MITVSAIVQGAIDRVQACLPERMKASVMRWPDKPEQFTPAVLRASHPHGALLVKHLESTGNGGAEVVIVGVGVVAETSLREEALAEAVRAYLNRYQVPGLTRYEFATDKQLEIEFGIICRTVAFSCNRPAVPAADIAAVNAALGV